MAYSEPSNKGYLISELPKNERPRERLLSCGCDALSNIELLAIILRTGPKGKSTLDLAKELLSHFKGNLVELSTASPTTLSTIRGIGKAKSAELKATFALASRMARQISLEKQKISDPEGGADFFREYFRGKKQEELHVLLLNTKNIIIHEELITKGLLDRSPIHAREIFRTAIQHSAAKMILAHNHPSGDPTPSKQDISSTKKLVQAGRIIGIEVVDHIIIGLKTAERESDFFSLCENGMMD